MPYQDPLDSNRYIRVTGKNEAIDGNGNRYRIERKYDCEFAPFLFTAGIVGILASLLSGCGLDRPYSTGSNPTASPARADVASTGPTQPALTQQPVQLEQRSGF